MRICWIPTLAAVMAMFGCESPPTQTAAPGALSPTAAALRERLTSTENGLEVRRWMVQEHNGRLAVLLAQYADKPATDDRTADRFKRNGFRFVRLPLESLQSLLEELGGASYDATEWHGQVHDWRPLIERPIEAPIGGGRAVAIDGVVQRFDRGEFRLMLRSWTVQMEDGPYVHLEMIPRRRLPATLDYRAMLGGKSDNEIAYGSMALDLLLEAGYAYVLLGQSPQSEWPTDSLDAFEQWQFDGTALPERDSNGGRSAIGPDVIAPPTLGELLLAPNETAARRTIVIFVPKVGADLYLPEQIAARSNRAERW